MGLREPGSHEDLLGLGNKHIGASFQLGRGLGSCLHHCLSRSLNIRGAVQVA